MRVSIDVISQLRPIVCLITFSNALPNPYLTPPTDPPLPRPPPNPLIRIPPRRPHRRPLPAPHQKRRPQRLSLPLMLNQPLHHLRLHKPAVFRQTRHTRTRAPRLQRTHQDPHSPRHKSINGSLNSYLRRGTVWFECRRNMSDAHAQRHAAIWLPSPGSRRLDLLASSTQARSAVLHHHSGRPASASLNGLAAPPHQSPPLNHYH